MVDSDGFGPRDLEELEGVSRETLERLELVVARLHEWRGKVNLIGPKEYDRLWRRHIFDSLVLLPHLLLNSRIIDFGSGAGFPGLMIAAALSGEDGHITLMEKVGKKCAFLRDVISALSLPASVHQGRIEDSKVEPVDYLTARAFAPLPRMLDLAEPWTKNRAKGVFLKGRLWEQELTEASKTWRFNHVVIPNPSGGDGVILKLSEISRVRS